MNSRPNQVIRQGKSNIFKKDWDKGHDPLKPYIEEEDEKGNKIKRNPTSKTYNIYDMKIKDLDDFLGDEEKAAMEAAIKHKKEYGNRDLCKEKQDEKDNIIKQQQTEIDSLKDILFQHNELLKKISERLK